MDTVDHRHLVIGRHRTADETAQCPPFGPGRRLVRYVEARGSAAPFVQVEAVARRAARKRGRQGGRPTLVISARTLNRI